MMHILFNRVTPWQSTIRCSTNIYAELFMRHGYKVSYMQGKIHIGQVLLKRGRYESWKRGARHDKGGFVFTPFSLLPTNRRGPFSLPQVIRWSHQVCIPSIKSYVERSGYGTPDVIWTATPGGSALRRLFPKALTVFQVIDYYRAFAGASMHAIEKQDYHTVDHIFSIGHALTRYLVDELDVPQEKITTLGQGVHLDNYQKNFVEPLDIADLPHPRAIWVGVLSKGDPELFATVANEIRALHGSLILIGPSCEWAETLARSNPHVHLLGSRVPDIVPDYLRSSDIGLMLYDRKKMAVYRGQHPLKLYEYAAAGLPIISTPHDEYNYLKPPVEIVADVSAISRILEKLIESADDYRTRALDFASKNTWESKFVLARKIINQLLGQ